MAYLWYAYVQNNECLDVSLNLNNVYTPCFIFHSFTFAPLQSMNVAVKFILLSTIGWYYNASFDFRIEIFCLSLWYENRQFYVVLDVAFDSARKFHVQFFFFVQIKQYFDCCCFHFGVLFFYINVYFNNYPESKQWHLMRFKNKYMSSSEKEKKMMYLNNVYLTCAYLNYWTNVGNSIWFLLIS